jgi:hypothetical protein
MLLQLLSLPLADATKPVVPITESNSNGLGIIRDRFLFVERFQDHRKIASGFEVSEHQLACYGVHIRFRLLDMVR